MHTTKDKRPSFNQTVGVVTDADSDHKRKSGLRFLVFGL
jgi:hypothetical protein